MVWKKSLARKNHICSSCKETITKGNTYYVDYNAKSYDTPDYVCLCEKCDGLIVSDELIKEEIEAQKKGEISMLWFLINLGVFSVAEIEKIEKRLGELKQRG